MSKPIRPFSGSRSDFPAWDMDLIENLRGRCPERIFGATGLVLTADKYNAQQQLGLAPVPFDPPADPGLEPALPPIGATALEMSRYEIEMKIFVRRETAFKDWLKISSSISEDLRAASPAEALDLIKHPIHGMLRVTSAQLYAHLCDMYSILSSSDLKDNLDTLLTPYDPNTSFAVYVAWHTQVHHTQESNGQAMRPQEQLAFFQEGTKQCGLFEQVKILWAIAHPAVAQQAFGGPEGLAHALLEFEKTLSRNATAKSAGYSAAVLPNSTAPTMVHLQAQIATLQAQVAAASSPAAIGTGGGGRGGGGRGRGGGRGSGAGPLFYCWTHGIGGHASPSCTKRKLGHDIAATYYNQLGGEKC